MLTFLVGLAFGVCAAIFGALVGLVYMALRTKKEPAPKRPTVPYAQLNAEGKLARLERLDALFDFAFGDEPVPYGKLWRKER